ncbi:MAG: class I SAM-dependent methyltransferase, partial [Pseudomonadota bacterium]
KPGGLFFVFEHNPWNPLTVHAVNNCPFDENAVLIPAPVMRGRVREAGWRDVALSYRVFFPGPLAALRPPERGMTWLPIGAQYYTRARA